MIQTTRSSSLPRVPLARKACKLSAVKNIGYIQPGSWCMSSCSDSFHCQSGVSRRGTLYVHWPYCAQLCTYCNFNKYMSNHVENERLYSCMEKEFQLALSKSSISLFTSVYFGGGTPSLAGPRLVDTVLNAVGKHSILDRNAEICLEANPSSAQLSKLNEFKVAGVNRLSLGMQSLDDDDLKLINRDHTSEEGQRSLKDAISVFPGRVNIDVIFGRPGQTLCKWTKELKDVIQLADNHVSLYQLTVERGTPLAVSVKNGQLIMPDEDAVADMYEHAVQLLEEAHFCRYEVSNFAKEGFESRHNLSYWTGRDYIGIGPGAHSRYLVSSPDEDGGHFSHTVNSLEPNAWAKSILATGSGVTLEKQLCTLQRLEEVIVTSLRTQDGLTNEVWKQFSSEPLAKKISHATEKSRLDELLKAGLLIVDTRGLRASSKGLNVLDSILPEVVSML